MIIRSFKIILLTYVVLWLSPPVHSQTNEYNLNGKNSFPTIKQRKDDKISFADSTDKKLVTQKSISALFLGIGGGLSIPLSPFNNNSDVTFGILGRLEFASTSIFPFVIGAEVDYFSYSGSDEFETQNLLSSFATKILSFGLNIEYSLVKILRSSFTMPFLTIDVKNNQINREYESNTIFVDLPKDESKISVGAGFGLTLFVFDFYVKYNYMKNNSNVTVYTKTKIPIMRF